MSKKLKICFLSEYAYSLITGNGQTVGGAELQMVNLSKELKKRSYDVSFVTFEKSNSSYELIEGIKVYNPFNNHVSGYTYLFPHNLHKLLKILNKIDADVYIQRATSPLTGFMAFFARLKNKIFIYSASSDNDVSINLVIKNIKDLKKLFYKFGVKHCDFLICQTNHQKNLLKETISKEGKVIKNIYLSPKIEFNKKKVSQLKILWVGRISSEKRPEIFLKLAEKIPEFNFWMIGAPSKKDPEYYKKIKEATSKINNLDFIGFVPHNKIERFYKESLLLINTSLGEGFPNTFLEAWGNYTPVVSLGFDPDEIICNNKLGFHSKNFDDLVKDTKLLIKNSRLRKEMGINGRKYIEKEHNVEKITNEYLTIFEVDIGKNFRN